MFLVQANHHTFKRTARLTAHALVLVALLNTVEHPAKFGKPARLVSSHNRLLAQDTIRQVGGIGIEPQQRHDKKHRRTQQKAKAVKLLR